MLKKIRHIGIIGDNFEGTVDRLKAFGFDCTQIMKVQEIGASIAFLSAGEGETAIEFISHTEEPHDPLSKMIAKQKGVINHICVEVDDLEATIRHFEKNGAVLAQGCPRQGAHGRIAFFSPETTEGILLELCEV